MTRGSADDLRLNGLVVTAHADYRNAGGIPVTYWILTYEKDGTRLAFRGDGPTDADALDEVRRKFAKHTDKLHHAPACPANHYCGERAPTGPCNCGAVEFARGAS